MNMNHEKGIEALDKGSVSDIICCPGGVEVTRNDLKGPLENTLKWREDMMEKGMEGFVEYEKGEAVGFVEYMPAENVPLPVIAPGAAVLMCFHWVKPSMSDEEHLKSERELVERVIEATSESFTGLAALAWDHPTHFSLEMMKDMGFQEIEKDDCISLVWYPHEETEPPKMMEPSFQPRDISNEGLLAIDQAFSNRCPFSIHSSRRFKRWIEELDEQRIQHELFTIDTREKTKQYSISPWGWEWLFLNGEKIETFRLKKDDLVEAIENELDRL